MCQISVTSFNYYLIKAELREKAVTPQATVWGIQLFISVQGDASAVMLHIICFTVYPMQC